MQTPAFHRWEPYTRIPSSSSSLDVGLLAGAPVQDSLLSESITFDSLSSKSSDVPPVFYPRTFPTIKTIGLGDRLHMFSSGKSQPNDPLGKQLNPTVVISSPTMPRLKSMLKECLSIKKWAETSAVWHAPGHTPWEGLQETVVKHWVPDGSLFSPDCFALALSQPRISLNKFWPCWRHHCPSEPRSNFQDFQSVLSPAQDLMQTELLDVVDELKTIRSFFQEPPQEEQVDESSDRLIDSNRLHIPSLVVSNSQFTFPITLGSSYSLSHCDSVSLARRRGKMTPPRLRLEKGEDSQELSYPDIPTAFLGSPSRYHPQFDDANLNKPTLPFEEMINNLRLQCSTMALETPPIDTSWNSRACLESEPLSHDNSISSQTMEGDEWAFAQSLIDDCKLPSQPNALSKTNSSYRLKVPTQRSVCGPTMSALSQAREVKDTEVTMKTTVEAIEPSTNSPDSAVSNVKSFEQGLQQIVTCPAIHPSAMAKRKASYTRKPMKRVRFILTHQEVETDITPAKTLDDDARVEVLDRRQETPETPAAPKRMLSKHLSRKSFAISRSSSSISTWKRARSATVGSPLRRSVISKMFPESDVVKPDLTDLTALRRSTQSLGRHSLSRIIKGPMFSSKDVKCAITISSMSIAGEMATDENAVRRGSGALNTLDKKSRMPVPLRNILTRFK